MVDLTQQQATILPPGENVKKVEELETTQAPSPQPAPPPASDENIVDNVKMPPSETLVPARSKLGPMTDAERTAMLDRTRFLPAVDATPDEMSRFMGLVPDNKLKDATIDELYAPYATPLYISSIESRSDKKFIGPPSSTEKDELQKIGMANDAGMFVQYDMRQQNPKQHPLDPTKYIKQDPTTGKNFIDYQYLQENGGFISYINVGTRKSPKHIPIASMSPRQKMAIRNKYSAIAGFHYVDETLAKEDYVKIVKPEDASSGKRFPGQIVTYNLLRKNQEAIGQTLDANMIPTHTYDKPSWFESSIALLGAEVGLDPAKHYDKLIAKFEADTTISEARRAAEIQVLRKNKARVIKSKGLRIEQDEDLARLLDSYRALGFNEVQINGIVSGLQDGSYERLRSKFVMGDIYADLGNTVFSLPFVFGTVPFGEGSLVQPFESGKEPTSESDDPNTIGALVTAGWAFLKDIKEGRNPVFSGEDNLVGDKIDVIKFAKVSDEFANVMGVSPETARKALSLHTGFWGAVKETGEKAAPAAVGFYLVVRGLGKTSVDRGLIPFLQTKEKYANKTRQEILNDLASSRKKYEYAQSLYFDNKFKTSFSFGHNIRRNAVSLAQDATIQATRQAKNIRNVEVIRRANGFFDEAKVLRDRASQAATASERNALNLQAASKTARAIWTSLTGFPSISPIAKGEIATEAAFAIGGGTGIYLAQKYLQSGDSTAFELGGGFLSALTLPTMSRLLVEKGVEPIARLTGELILAGTPTEFSKVLRSASSDFNLSATETRQLKAFYNNMTSRMSPAERRELLNATQSYTKLVKELSELPGSTITSEDVPVLIGDLVFSTYLKGIGDYLSIQGGRVLSGNDLKQLLDFNSSLSDARESLRARMAETLQKTEPFRGNLSEESEIVLSKIFEARDEALNLLDESVETINAVSGEFRSNLNAVLRDGVTHAGGTITQEVNRIFDQTIDSLERSLDQLEANNAPVEKLREIQANITELRANRNQGIEKYFEDVEKGILPMDAESVAQALQKMVRDEFKDGQRDVKDFYKTVEKQYSTTYADQTDVLLDLFERQAADAAFFPDLFRDPVRVAASKVAAKTPKQTELSGVAQESARRFFSSQVGFKPNEKIKTPSELINKFVNQLPDEMKERYAFSGRTNMDAFIWYRKFTQEITPDELRFFGEFDDEAPALLKTLGIDGMDERSIEQAANLATLDLSAVEMDLIVKGLNQVLKNPNNSGYNVASNIKNRLLQTEDADGNPVQFIKDKYGSDPQIDTEFIKFYKDKMTTVVRPHYAKFDDKLLKEIGTSGELDGNYFKKIIDALNDPKKTNPANPIDTAEHINNTVLETARKAFGTYDPKTGKFYLVAGSDGAKKFRTLLLNHYRERFFNSPQGEKIRNLLGDDELPLNLDLKGDTELRGLEALKDARFHTVNENGDFILDTEAPMITDDDIFGFGSLDNLINTPFRTQMEEAEAVIDAVLKDVRTEAGKISTVARDRVRNRLYRYVKAGSDPLENLTDMEVLFKYVTTPSGLEEIKKVRSNITDPDELMAFDDELKLALVSGVVKDTTSRPEKGVEAGKLLFDIGGATKVLEGPEYVGLRNALNEFHPDLTKTLSLFDELSERVLKRGSPLSVQAGPKSVDTLAVLNRGRQIQLRQVSPTYVAMEIVAKNSSARKFNGVATILSSPVLTREFIKMIETGKPLDPQIERRISSLFLKTSMKIAAMSYSDDPVTGDNGNISGKELVAKFEESVKNDEERFVSQQPVDYDESIERLKKYNPYFNEGLTQ
tara:strand:- start:692 stop:6037 length:5346 start_codon:yes stop_codon:yes gene_type:complete